MNRTTVIQDAINHLSAQTYLEIGVFAGDCFLPVRVPLKIAVDPCLKIGWHRKLIWKLRHRFQYTSQYFEVTSDEFFSRVEGNQQISSKKFDVIFIDGMHTHRQSLKDVNNALKVLADPGIIIMHDCYPPNSAAAYPANSLEHARSLNLPEWTGEWCGDTWKTICHLRATRADLNIFVLNCDYGLGVITKGVPEKRLEMTEEQIEVLTFDDLENAPLELINLKQPGHWTKFMRRFEV
ncbi:MAG TPA: class I SAM-dependent methyltransferase [Planctomicrobium sp.]|nr:class I SAM-dependent methyltransferase [Planctomicrobium sp.]